MRLPKTKKKRIIKKYLPKGPYCHRGLSEVCPYWCYRRATAKDLPKIYAQEKDILKKDGVNSYAEFLKYLNKLPEKDQDFFLDIYECKLLHYTEYCQESLLWDQVKECDW